MSSMQTNTLRAFAATALGIMLLAGTMPGPALAAAGGHDNGDHGGPGGDHGNGGGASANAAANASGHDSGHGHADKGAVAAAAGALNAAHASPTALAHAAPGSTVGKIASYDRAMLAALAMPANTPAQIAARNTAIAAARGRLAASSNKSLTPAVVSRVDALLGLPAVDPTLGARSGI